MLSDASSKRKQQTQALNATSNGGDASRASGIKAKTHTLITNKKDSQTALIIRLSVSLFLNARRGTRRPH